MCLLLKLDYAKFGVSNLFSSKVIKEKLFLLRGGWLDPLGKGRVKNVANVAEPLKLLQMLQSL